MLDWCTLPDILSYPTPSVSSHGDFLRTTCSWQILTANCPFLWSLTETLLLGSEVLPYPVLCRYWLISSLLTMPMGTIRGEVKQFLHNTGTGDTSQCQCPACNQVSGHSCQHLNIQGTKPCPNRAAFGEKSILYTQIVSQSVFTGQKKEHV